MKYVQLFESYDYQSIEKTIEIYNNFIDDIKPYIKNLLGDSSQYNYFIIHQINKYGDKYEFTVKTFDKLSDSLTVNYINISVKELKSIIEQININKTGSKYNL